jgi:hypothetical protein
VTGSALELLVGTFERIGCELLVVESLDLERIGDVTRIARAFGRGETKLPRVHIPVAPAAFTGRASIGRAFAAQPVSFGGAVAAVAGGLGVGAGQRPGAVVDPRRLPPSLGMAVSASPVAHLGCKLIAVRVVVAVDAALCPELQVVAGPFALVTTGAADRLMLAI